MDISEQIVRAWLEIQGFLVQSRVRYKIYSGTSAGWGDIDLIGYRVKDHKRVAIDISAWMTKDITLSYVTKENSNTYYRLFKSSFPEARDAIRKAFGGNSDDQYELWLVVSYIGPTQKADVEAECLKYVDRVVEFPTIMKDLIEHIKKNPNLPQETEALQTIRALVLCEILK